MLKPIHTPFCYYNNKLIHLKLYFHIVFYYSSRDATLDNFSFFIVVILLRCLKQVSFVNKTLILNGITCMNKGYIKK